MHTTCLWEQAELLVDLAMALVKPWCIRPRKQQKEKKTNSTSPNPHGSLTYQDCNHDADILGILPKYITRGDFCKVCQSAKEHQKAQHLNQRSGLQRERGPRSGQPRAALALFTQIRMLRQSKKKQSLQEFFQWVLLLAVLQAHICNTKQ